MTTATRLNINPGSGCVDGREFGSATIQKATTDRCDSQADPFCDSFRHHTGA